MPLITTRIQVRDLEHLKQLANIEYGNPPAELVVIIASGQDITLIKQMTLQYEPNLTMTELAWTLEIQGQGPIYFTEEDFDASGIPLAISQGSLFVEQIEEQLAHTLDYAVRKILPGTEVVANNVTNDIVYYGRKTWDEFLIPPEQIKLLWYLANGSLLIVFQSGDQLLFEGFIDNGDHNYIPLMGTPLYESIRVPSEPMTLLHSK